MAKAINKKIPLDRMLFAALHRKIIEVAYPDLKERAEMSKSVRLFYGYGPKIDHRSISAQMIRKLKHHIRGRALDDYVRSYNKNEEKILISKKHLDDYLNFIDVNVFEDLYDIADNYKVVDPSFPPYRIVIKPEKYPLAPLCLKNISKSNWWIYSFYEDSKSDNQGILRRILVFNNPDSVRLLDKYTYLELSGRVVKVVNNTQLICHFDDKGILLNARFRIEETGNKDLYMGIFLANDLRNEIYSHSIILQRIIDTEDPFSNLFFFSFEDKNIKRLPPKIIDFFKYDQNSISKIPALFNLDSLEESAEKEIDVFVAATVSSFKKKKDQFNHIAQNIDVFLKNFLEMEGFQELNQRLFQQIEGRLKHIGERIHRIINESEFASMGPFSSANQFDNSVREMIASLKNEIPEFNGKYFHYFSAKETDPEVFKRKKSMDVFNRDFELIKKSRAFILINPFNNILSSCWVMTGWAIMLGIPVFIVYRNEADENLPFILGEDNRSKKVYLCKLRSDDLAREVILWFKANKDFIKYF